LTGVTRRPSPFRGKSLQFAHFRARIEDADAHDVASRFVTAGQRQARRRLFRRESTASVATTCAPSQSDGFTLYDGGVEVALDGGRDADPAEGHSGPIATAAGRLLAEAAERIAELGYVSGCPTCEYVVTGREVLTDMLNSPRSSRAMVAANYETLRRVSGRRTFRAIVRWVDTVRPALLADRAYDMNRAADWTGASGGYVVASGRKVANENTPVVLLPVAATTRPSSRPIARVRAGRRRRSSSTRRSSRGSPDREPSDPSDPSRRRDSGARPAA
jgi:hypothetical protein